MSLETAGGSKWGGDLVLDHDGCTDLRRGEMEELLACCVLGVTEGRASRDRLSNGDVCDALAAALDLIVQEEAAVKVVREVMDEYFNEEHCNDKVNSD